MSLRVVRYRTKPDRADENAQLVRAVFAELAEREPAGIRYATLSLADGTFVHIVATDSDDAPNPLNGIDAFQQFTSDIAERCEVPPVVADAAVVGSYGFGLA